MKNAFVLNDHVVFSGLNEYAINELYVSILAEEDLQTLELMYPDMDARELRPFVKAAEDMVATDAGWPEESLARHTYRMAVLAFLDWKLEELFRGFTPRWYAARDSFDCFRRYCAKARAA